MKKLLVLGFFLAHIHAVFCQNVQVTAQAPKVVEAGEQFQLDFTINAEPSNFIVPALHDFQVVYGPSTSQSSVFQNINGRMSQSVTYTYSYVLNPTKAGKYIIGAAEVTVGGKKYKSNPINIEVVGSGSQKAQSQAGANSQTSQSQPQQEVSADGNIFLRVIIDKKNVYQGEYLSATIKLYTKYDLSGITNAKLPAFDNFFKQDIPTPINLHLERENVNGEIYLSGVVKKYILIPQRSGNIVIDPMSMDLVIQKPVQQRSRGFFDDFFGPSVQEVPVKIKSKPVTISVKPLPANAPNSFTGAVGHFIFDAKVDKNEVKTNDAITLKVTVSGNGNIKLIEPPKITFPSDFDTYDPKITTNTNDAAGGTSGSKTFEYVVIPRNPGDFTIPPLAFTYFDVASSSYKRETSPEFKFHVEKGPNQSPNMVAGSATQEDVRFLGKDILYIKTGNLHFNRIGSFFFGSTVFYLIFFLSLLAFAIIIWLRRRIIRQNANIAYVKNRRADKYATQRLKQAFSHLNAKEQERFYEELLKAIWGYLSDKFNISLSELSREKALETLKERNVEEEDINAFIQLVDNCEFARYAPSSAGISMKDDYDKAISLITKLQKKLR